MFGAHLLKKSMQEERERSKRSPNLPKLLYSSYTDHVRHICLAFDEKNTASDPSCRILEMNEKSVEKLRLSPRIRKLRAKWLQAAAATCMFEL